ncbi:hypothetical protein [Flexivirga alba]|uniref:DUF3558 domain-containing protein n=1 Tax=Flexivirga alba TaxID=702742 RepID=A0ABW2AM10_9MICO
MARARAAYVGTSVVVAVGLLAGCGGGGSSGTKSAPPWTEGSTQDGLIAAKLPAASSGRKVVSGGAPWSFTLAKADDPNVPSSQWPSADSVLTSEQLRGAIPEATSVTLGKCVKGVNGPSSTDKNASCTWSVALKGGGGYTNEIVVSIVTIGADEKVSEPWTSERNTDFSSRKSGERFFTSGSFSAKGSYYLDNNLSSVLVSDGNLAAWINLTFNGFNSLNDSRNTMLTGVFPVLAKDLADRMPRKYA